MKRLHRRWHHRLGWILVPALAATLLAIAWTGDEAPRNPPLPPVLTGAPAAQGP